MKFGGTSVGKPERMKQIASLLTKQTEPAIVVLSALSGTTNALVKLGTILPRTDILLCRLLIIYRRITKILLGNYLREDLYNKAKSIVDEHFIFYISSWKFLSWGL